FLTTGAALSISSTLGSTKPSINYLTTWASASPPDTRFGCPPPISHKRVSPSHSQPNKRLNESFQTKQVAKEPHALERLRQRVVLEPVDIRVHSRLIRVVFNHIINQRVQPISEGHKRSAGQRRTNV